MKNPRHLADAEADEIFFGAHSRERAFRKKIENGKCSFPVSGAGGVPCQHPESHVKIIICAAQTHRAFTPFVSLPAGICVVETDGAVPTQ